jgi:hypothetical protein
MKVPGGDLKGNITDINGCPFWQNVGGEETCVLRLKKPDCNTLAEYIEGKVIMNAARNIFREEKGGEG